MNDSTKASNVQSLATASRSEGRLERLLRNGQFAVTTELAPPNSADPESVYARAAVFDGYVDAINVTDGSGGNCHMSSLGACTLLAQKGYAPVLQMTCRDRNRIAIQADLLGAAALGVCNVLCLTGDGVAGGDHPDAKPVFDLDGLSLLQTLRTLRDEGQLLSGRKLSVAPKLMLGAAIDPLSPADRERPVRFEQKLAAGADFVQTQYVFDVDAFAQYMQRARDAGIHQRAFILAGVGPLASARSADWMRNNIPGIAISDAIVERLRRSRDPAAEGVALCQEIISRLCEIEGVHGVHIMAHRQEHRVPEIVSGSGILGDRRPWAPAEAGGAAA